MNTEIAFLVLVLYLCLLLDLYTILVKFLHPNERNAKKERRSWTDNIIGRNALRMDTKTIKENTDPEKQLGYVPLQCSYRDGGQVTPVNKVRQCGSSWRWNVFKRWWTSYWVKMKEKTKQRCVRLTGIFFSLNLRLTLGLINRRPSLLHNSRPWHFLVPGNQNRTLAKKGKRMWCKFLCLFAQHLSFTVFIYFKIKNILKTNFYMLVFHPWTFLVEEQTTRSKGARSWKILAVNIVKWIKMK